MTSAHKDRDIVPFGEAVRTWFAISLQTFGGPAGQIAVMQRALVEDKRWIGQQRFNHALSYCMVLPGPEAQQLAVYTGWLLNGTRGGLVAGVLFVLPGVVSLLALSVLYVGWGETAFVAGLFAGLAPAVLAIVAQAVVRVGRRSLTGPALVALAVGAFLALAVFAVPFPLVIVGAAVTGWLLGRARPALMREEPADGPEPLVSDAILHHEPPSLGRSGRVLGIGLLVWAAPVVAVAVFTGVGGVLTTQGVYFSGMALVTFGGAYAALSYVAQAAVQTYGWLGPQEMVRGLALAETTPGPLIMVVQFVAFLGAYRDPGGLDPWAAALLGALLTSWVTFVPCFLFIFLGAPYVERLRGNATIAAALGGITAAVVGVIANLGFYFALHTLFAETFPLSWGPVQATLPDLSSVRYLPLGLAALAAVMVFRLNWGIPRVLLVSAGLGLAATAVGLG
ncbi:chromate efflux transporter [Actinocorallia sp. A-T 12471]|uniref:chromate efflux transporter n=1 Tax=Actinocorallia sp. A-T 12471 TaxID=3089813 RepID=UPI0029CB0195|nr:chromate efflux transporter [Actinocorallia sp. A-T 12471]MDX6740769.1 chromate efflux transporter [Actinocorallia sp. A-T 12471]